jgi:hypothetical protein
MTSWSYTHEPACLVTCPSAEIITTTSWSYTHEPAFLVTCPSAERITATSWSYTAFQSKSCHYPYVEVRESVWQTAKVMDPHDESVAGGLGRKRGFETATCRCQRKEHLLQEATVAPPTAVEAANGEIKELVDTVKMIERLIVKSEPHQASLSASDLVDDDEYDLGLFLDGDNDDVGKDDDLLNDVPSHTLLP